MVHSFQAHLGRAWRHFSWPLCLCAAACAAQAQPTPRANRPDPLDAQASVPPLRYESSLKSVTKEPDDKPISWREANDRVARIGGWRVYAREAQQTPATPAKEPPR
jgi:hypothetical protein